MSKFVPYMHSKTVLDFCIFSRLRLCFMVKHGMWQFLKYCTNVFLEQNYPERNVTRVDTSKPILPWLHHANI